MGGQDKAKSIFIDKQMSDLPVNSIRLSYDMPDDESTTRSKNDLYM